MVGLIRSAYLPMWNNHDPRIPPFGRVVAAEVRQLSDGECAVEAEIEVFEEGDSTSRPLQSLLPLPKRTLQLTSTSRMWLRRNSDSEFAAELGRYAAT
jgi:hypothetical protein